MRKNMGRVSKKVAQSKLNGGNPSNKKSFKGIWLTTEYKFNYEKKN